jgi:hypothetical protein
MHPEDSSNSSDNNAASAAMQAAVNALGRVYTATTLPSHIWSLNGEFYLFIYFILFLGILLCFLCPLE